MAILSPLRARRNANRPVESTQQVIIFCLHQQWFALPMAFVKRVTAFQSSADKPSADKPSADKPSADKPSANKSSANKSIERPDAAGSTDDEALTIINAARRIFLKSRSFIGSQEPEVPKQESPEPERFVIVFQASGEETYALTISSEPKMHRISPESIAPFLPTDKAIEPMACISGIVQQADHPQTLYLLDPEQLCYSALSDPKD
jgi:chemotaxis signal transduction protein